MGYFEAAGHAAVYAAALVGILYIAALGALFFRRAYLRAAELGHTKEWVMKAFKTAAAYSLIPAVTVLIGLFTIAPLLGVPLSWWRLSVVGNTAYEIMAADTALGARGAGGAAETGAAGFVLVMFVMAIGIIGGLILAPLLSKRVQKGILKISVKDRRWSAYSAGTYMGTIIVALVVPLLFGVSAALLTLVTAALVTAAMNAAAKRTGAARLAEFSFVAGMLAAMASSVLWTRLLGG
ncbi:MAG: DUF5058 family protein [Oscillospiraceae bacterium]|nr:DUF5058 family protein [Oscillospiraceae bacterium]